MKEKIYPIKGIYYTSYALLILFSFGLMLVHIYLESFKFFLQLGLLILWVFHYRWATGGLVIINGDEAIIRPSTFETHQINLTSVKRIETPKNKKIILYPDGAEKVSIPLKLLSEEHKRNLLMEIPVLVYGKPEEDYSQHLVD